MAVTLISETEVIPVGSISVLLFGTPGSGKTSLAQTAERPITFDFDRGAHRSVNRKAALRFDSWDDVIDLDESVYADYKTIVIDTVGRMLDLMKAHIVREVPKSGRNDGSLTITGWGALKMKFSQFSARMRLLNKDVVMIAHEKEERDGDDRFFRPEIEGGSYTEVIKFTDIIGYLYTEKGGRFLDCNPSESHTGKNAARWDVIKLNPSNPNSLAELISDAKSKIGQLSEESAKLAKIVDDWKSWINSDPHIDSINMRLTELSTLNPSIKKQIWHIIKDYAKENSMTFSDQEKKFKEA